jgi:hypothetical protein
VDEQDGDEGVPGAPLDLKVWRSLMQASKLRGGPKSRSRLPVTLGAVGRTAVLNVILVRTAGGERMVGPMGAGGSPRYMKCGHPRVLPCRRAT